MARREVALLRTLGAPYTDEEIAASVEAVKGKTQMEAVIAYLQVLGIHRTASRPAAAAASPDTSTAVAAVKPVPAQ